jgi:type II secretory pathway pseudopilin PulG
MRNTRDIAGRSIVEMLGVLAIMGVITVIGIAGYQKAVAALNRSGTVSDVAELAQEVRSLYSGHSFVDSNLQSNVIGVRGMTGDTIPNRFGGYYELGLAGTPINGDGVQQSAFFKITITHLPQTDCIFLSTQNWPDARDRDGKDNGGRAIIGDGTGASGTCQTGAENKITLVYQS